VYDDGGGGDGDDYDTRSRFSFTVRFRDWLGSGDDFDRTLTANLFSLCWALRLALLLGMTSLAVLDRPSLARAL